ncbi:MAG: large subunit ribosomal protein L5 [Candidatus Krumholzibacteriia bacterium]
MDQTDLSNRIEAQDDGTKNVLLEEANMAAAKPRMRDLFETETVKALQEKFAYASPMQMPKPVKVVINMGLGRAQQNPKILESAVAELEAITGQKAVTTKARKSISNFKLREGVAIGARVTLRDKHMWEFLDRFINVTLPRIRDFRGVPTRLSGAGDYTIGLKDQLIFPEIEYDKVDEPRGMNVTIVTTATNDEEGRELLRLLGMPFRR